MADTDLEIMGDPVSKTSFSALRASVSSKNKAGGGGRPPRAPPLDPPLGMHFASKLECGQVKGVGLGEEPGPHGPVLFSKSKMAATVLVSKLPCS